MKKTLLALLCGSTLLLSACDSKTPNCSAKESTDLVIQIIDRDAAKLGLETMDQVFSRMFGLDSDTKVIKIHNIRTLKHNKDTDAYLCEADFLDVESMFSALQKKFNKTFSQTEKEQLLARMRNQNTEVRYTIHKSDDGKQFFVNVLND